MYVVHGHPRLSLSIGIPQIFALVVSRDNTCDHVREALVNADSTGIRRLQRRRATLFVLCTELLSRQAIVAK
jgi:hypothetical protein